MKINTWIKYTKGYLQTPRHRKLKYKECEEYIDIELKEVSINDVNKKYSVNDKVYYEYKNNLYIKADRKDISNFKQINDPIENLKYCYKNCSTFFGFNKDDTKEKMVNKVVKDINKYLLIDNILYIKTFRPFYRIYTFGLGNNHGGTSLLICNKDFEYCSDENFIFEAKDREKAIKHALNIAENRKDTDSIIEIKNTPLIIEY